MTKIPNMIRQKPAKNPLYGTPKIPSKKLPKTSCPTKNSFTPKNPAKTPDFSVITESRLPHLTPQPFQKLPYIT